MAKGFIPELWSKQIMKSYTQTLFDTLLPMRTRGAQLLRDYALGKPEFGPEMGDGPRSVFDNGHIQDSASYLSPTAGPATWTNNTTAADPSFTTVATGV